MADVNKRTIRARVELTENEVPGYNQEYLKEDTDFTESAHNRAVLAAAMATAQELDISNVSTPAVLMIECERSMELSIDTAANVITLGDAGFFAMVGTFTKVFVKNLNANYTNSIEFVVTD